MKSSAFVLLVIGGLRGLRVRRRPRIALSSVALVLAGGSGCGHSPAADVAATDAKPVGAKAGVTGPIGVVDLEFEDGRFDTFLSHLDPAALRPRGRRADVGEFHDTWSVSPDGRQVALGQGGQGLGVQIYDLARMKRLRAVHTGIAAETLAWLKPRRIVAVLQSKQVVVVDPTTGRILHRQPLRRDDRVCYGRFAAATASGLVVMLRAAPDAAPRLIVVDAEGRARSVLLPEGPLWGCGRSGLAVNAHTNRAFVVSRSSLVAQIDLATMTVTYHRVRGTPLRNALPREVYMLDDHQLVASGRDKAGRPAGASIIDTATWINRVIDRDAAMAQAVAGTVLAYDGDRVALPSGKRRGLSAYRPDGRKLFNVFKGQQIGYLAHAGTRAYAFDERVVRSVDVTTGRVIAAYTAAAARIRVTLMR